MVVCAIAHKIDIDMAAHATDPDAGMDEVFESVARHFAMLAEPSRLRILHVICQKEASVGEIVASSGMSQTGVSRHLNLMYQTGLVSRRREGSQVFYAVADPVLVDTCRTVCERVSDEFRRGDRRKRRGKGLVGQTKVAVR